MSSKHFSLKVAEISEVQTTEQVWQRAMALVAQTLGQESLPKKSCGKNDLEAAQLLLRLGFAETAVSCFRMAESCGLPPNEWAQSRLGLIRALWLAGHETEALSLVDSTWRYMQERPEVRRELTWLKQRWQMIKHSDLSVLFDQNNEEKLYLAYPYCVEVRLWSLIYKGKDLADLQNSLALGQRENLSLTNFWPQFFKIIANLQHEKETQAKALIALLGRKNELISVEEELLCFLVSARFLNLCGYQNLAKLAENAYRSISLNLTNGCNPAMFGPALTPLKAHYSAA